MDFSTALAAIKQGQRLQRSGWNGKGMFVALMNQTVSTAMVGDSARWFDLPEGANVVFLSHIVMRTADGAIVPWLASQTDLLAADWQVFEPQARPAAPLPTIQH